MMSEDSGKKRKYSSVEELRDLQCAADDAAELVCELENSTTPLPNNLRKYRNIRRSFKELISEDNDEGVDVIIEKCVTELDALYEKRWTLYETIKGMEEDALEKARNEEQKLRHVCLEASEGLTAE